MKKYLLIFAIILMAGCGGGGSSSTSSGGNNIIVNGTWTGQFTLAALSCGGSITFDFVQSPLASTDISGSVVADASACGGPSAVFNTFFGTVSGRSVSLTDNDGDIYSLTLVSGTGNVLSGTVTSSTNGASANITITLG